MQRLSKEQVDRVAVRSRALGDPTRVRLLDVLARAEQPVGQLAATVHCEPSLVSKHLQVLFHAGLVRRRREANAMIYSLSDDDVTTWCHYLAIPILRPRSGTPQEAS
jgi:DNA-binding transcriptional ArsR family regulator